MYVLLGIKKDVFLIFRRKQFKKNEVHSGQNTENKTQYLEHKTQKTELKAQNIKHRTQYTEHTAQNTVHRTLNTVHSAQTTLHRPQDMTQITRRFKQNTRYSTQSKTKLNLKHRTYTANSRLNTSDV